MEKIPAPRRECPSRAARTAAIGTVRFLTLAGANVTTIADAGKNKFDSRHVFLSGAGAAAVRLHAGGAACVVEREEISGSRRRDRRRCAVQKSDDAARDQRERVELLRRGPATRRPAGRQIG